MVDKQETCLAKIGGRLSDMALSLNKARDPNLSHDSKKDAQKNFESARDSIRKTALETYDNTALFSNGPAKPVTIAVPSGSQWEGLSVDRANLAQSGLIIMDKGKVYGDGEGYTIDPGSVKRAFDEWRKMCVSNRMQSSLLTHRLHGVKQKLRIFFRVITGMHLPNPPIPVVHFVAHTCRINPLILINMNRRILPNFKKQPASQVGQNIPQTTTWMWSYPINKTQGGN